MFADLMLSPRFPARSTPFLILLAFFASASAWAQDVRENKAPCPSASGNFPLMTYDERVQHYAAPDCRIGLLDSIQYVPFGPNENYYLSPFWGK